ncbi:hypothetical protein HNP69_001372 [Chryseobacterium koreense]|nr:hypothetical protein [Chryseobacterium koreense]MBB5333248.1 hypothetical protein [Chryseobacterium koreense]
MKTEYKKLNTGSQIMVGLTANIKTEIRKSTEESLYPRKISFNTISEKTSIGKSGFGDCANKNKIGRKTR